MDYVVMVTFPDSQHAYKAYTDVSAATANSGYTLQDMAIITKKNGHIFIPDNYNTGSGFGDDTVYGGLIGMVVGILGGPLGVLVGGAVGLAIGYAIDSNDIDEDDSMLFQVAANLSEGQTALVALVTEDDTAAFDSNFLGQDVQIKHWDAQEVAEEVRHAEELQKQMAKDAREKLRQQKKEARQARHKEHMDK